MPSRFPVRDAARKEFSRLFAHATDQRKSVWAFTHTPLGETASVIECGDNYVEAQRTKGRAVQARMGEIRLERKGGG